jgi:ubiquinol-cytochrome c reductase cytochrome c1 subunit
MITRVLKLLLLLPLAAFAASDGPALDRAPIDTRDVVSIQHGAKVFVNYCLGCHAASAMRYNRLMDLGLSEAQIRDNLLFAGQKVGDTMNSAMAGKQAKEWFGVGPPDLSVIARSRSPDWLYTYLRSFYRDDSRPSGWNNLTFENVAMPHVLYELQGMQVLEIDKSEAKHEKAESKKKLVLQKPGTLTPVQYDALIRDLVNYLVFMGEPARESRAQIGAVTLIFLFLFFVLSYALKRNYWNEVH